MSPNKDKKMMIQVDTFNKSFGYEADSFLLSDFDVFRNIKITPIDVVLSQKVGAFFGRKRLKGRGFYDITFLISKTDFNYDFLSEKLNISNKSELKKISDVDMKKISIDVQPFLINPDDVQRILSFREFIDQKL